MRFLAAAVAAVALTVPAAAVAAKPPKVGEVDYFKESGAQGPDTELLVFFRHAPDAVKLKAKFEGEKATAVGREHGHIDDNRYGHPWIPDPDEGRRELLNTMKESMDETGAVTLKVVASNDSGQTKTAVEIVLSECTQEPPIYPFSCVVEP